MTKREFKAEMQEVMRASKQRHRNALKKLLLPSDDSSDSEEDSENERAEIERLQGQIANAIRIDVNVVDAGALGDHE